MARKKLLFILDEGQTIAKQHNFSIKMLQLRHHNVVMFANFQNLSVAPIEQRANCDLMISFQATDKADRDVFAKAANLTFEQAEQLAVLEPGQCCCFLSRSGWKRPFLAFVPCIQFWNVDDQDIRKRSEEFLKGFSWRSIEDPGEQGFFGKEDANGLDAKAEVFLRDCLNQAHEFSRLTSRFERAGIRSAAVQGAVMRNLAGEGLIKIWSLAVGKGRPLKLVEPTQKAFESFDVTWKKTRGVLPTRAATEFVFRKMNKLDGWQCQKEGFLGRGDDRKQVDLLCRDPDNRIVTCEIAGNAEHEVHNALHCLKFDEVRKHVVVCVDKKVIEAVKKQFSQFPEINDSRVELITLAHAMSDKWSLDTTE